MKLSIEKESIKALVIVLDLLNIDVKEMFPNLYEAYMSIKENDYE